MKRSSTCVSGTSEVELVARGNREIESSFSFRISAGFAFLPFVWVVNVFWFFDSAFKKPAFDEQNAIRKCEYKKIGLKADDSFPILRCDLLSHRVAGVVPSDHHLGVAFSSKQDCLGRICRQLIVHHSIWIEVKVTGQF
jgi:hypothetical protein